MSKIINRLKTEDILNILNLLVFPLYFFCERKFLLISAALFLIACIISVVKKVRKQTISFFRYMWSFICTSVSCASSINILSNIQKLWILYIVVSMIFVYIITKNDCKSILIMLLYSFCLSAILHSMVIGINYSFCKDDEVCITATVVNKQKNGDWFDTNTFSQIDVHSSDTVHNENFGYQAISMVGDFYDRCEIDDEIAVYVNKGIFNIAYYYLKDE